MKRKLLLKNNNNVIIITLISTVLIHFNSEVFCDESIGFQHFHDFSKNFLTLDSLDDNELLEGAYTTTPFGVSYTLATLAAPSPFPVDLNGINNALKIDNMSNVNQLYGDLLDKFTQKSFETSNYLYTTIPMKTTNNLNTLDLKTFKVDFKNESSINVITDHISKNTFQTLTDSLIPAVPLEQLYLCTGGAIINTISYKYQWKGTWKNIGIHQFWDGYLTNFIESTQSFNAMVASTFSALPIPLEIGKWIVLVKPTDYDNTTSIMFDLLQNPIPTEWNSKHFVNITARVPVFNINSLHQIHQPLGVMGISPNTVCKSEPPEELKQFNNGYFLTPINQASHVHMGPNEFKVTSATGTSFTSETCLNELNTPKKEENYLNNNKPSPFNTVLNQENIDTKINSETVQGSESKDESEEDLIAKLLSYVNSTESNSSEKSSESIEERSKGESTEPNTLKAESNKIDFDKPFVWYLVDETLGVTQFGAIYSLKTYDQEQVINSEEEKRAYNTYKLLLWMCSFL